MKVRFIDATYIPGASFGINSIGNGFFYHRDPQYLITFLDLSTGKLITKDCYNDFLEYVKKNYNVEKITSEILLNLENEMKNGKIPFELY